MQILFETPRLIARRLARTDADALFTLFGDPETMQFYGSGRPWSRDEVERMLDTYPVGDARLISEPGIVLRKPDLTVVAYGGVGYFRQGKATAELFFIVAPGQRGQGIATELAGAALATAFQKPEITTVQATVMAQNGPSQRVLTKLGMRFRAYLPESDRLLYQIDREDRQPH